jgi:hypothetical protein
MEILNIDFLEKTYCDSANKVIIYIILHLNDIFCIF